MASKRLQKKRGKQALIKEIEEKQTTLGTLDKQIKSLGTGGGLAVSVPKSKAKSNKMTTAQLNTMLKELKTVEDVISEIYEVENINDIFQGKISEERIIEAAKYARNAVKDYSNAEMYAYIKKYNQLVNAGIIRKGSIMDKYDAGAFLDELLSDEQLIKITKQAEIKQQQLEEKYAEAKAKRATIVQF